MASKGGITITQDELIKMKMRANLIPSCTSFLTQLTANKTETHICTRKVRKEQINGLIT